MPKHLISTSFTFKVLYVAFVIAVVFYGQLRLMFGLTPRHIAIVVMLFACMRQGVPFPMGRIMKTYLVFILTFLVSATVTDYLDKVLITYYIAVYVGFWATKILVTKYKDGKLLLNIFIVTGVVNAIVTIGQAFGLHFADQLVSFLHISLPEEYIDSLNVKGGENMYLLLVRPGLLAGAVYNGYILMATGLISLSLLAHKFRLQRLIPWVIIFVGCFCVQERGPIIILAVLSAFAFFKTLFIKRNTYILLMIVFVLLVHIITVSVSSVLPVRSINTREGHSSLVIYNDYDESESDNWSKISRITKESRFGERGMEDPVREENYIKTLDYLLDHPFVAGVQRLRAEQGIYPHNLFLIAFAYGGIVGGTLILLILFWQIKPLWRVLRRKIADTNPVCFYAGLAYLGYTLNSLVHNRSIVTGDEVIWMLWATFYFEYIKFYPQDKRL